MKSIFSFNVLGLLLLLGCSRPKIEKDIILVKEDSLVKDMSIPPPPPWLERKPLGTNCPDDMMLIKEKHYCIDRYKDTNQESALKAVGYCRTIGKDLCTKAEWRAAFNSSEFSFRCCKAAQ